MLVEGLLEREGFFEVIDVESGFVQFEQGPGEKGVIIDAGGQGGVVVAEAMEEAAI